MMIAKNLKQFRMSNKQMVYVTFAISFVIVKDIFAYQLFKKDLNKYLFGKSNMANTSPGVV